MSASTSESRSASNTTNIQTTTQGGSGTNSPTLSAQGNITYQDAGGEVSIAALKGMADTIKAALTNAGNVNNQAFTTLANYAGQQVDSSTQQAASGAALIAQTLAANSELASHVQSNGTDQLQSTLKYVIYGAMAVIALVAVLLLRKKS